MGSELQQEIVNQVQDIFNKHDLAAVNELRDLGWLKKHDKECQLGALMAGAAHLSASTIASWKLKHRAPDLIIKPMSMKLFERLSEFLAAEPDKIYKELQANG